MKSTFSFFFLLFFGFSVVSQTPELDSLKRELDAYSGVDTSYILLRDDYALKKLYNNPSDTSLLGYTKQSLAQAQSLGWAKGEVISLQKVGIVHQFVMDNPTMAIDFYLKALSIIENDKSLKRFAYSSKANIATIYYNQQEFSKALERYKELYAEFGDQTIVEHHLGNTYGELHQYDSAIYYFNKAIDRSQKENNLTIYGTCMGSISLMYFHVDSLTRAAEAVQIALDILEQNGVEYALPTTLMNASVIHLGMEDYVKAEEYAKQALQLSEKWSLLVLKEAAYATLAEVYMMTNRGEEGFKAFQKHNLLRDSITNEDKRLEVSRKELEFEAEKEKLKTQAEVERQVLQKKIYLASTFGILGIGFLGLLLYRRDQRVKQKEKENQYKIGLAESKLVALRTQLNPHFIFNALNSIDDYMHKYGAEKASDYLAQFSSLMRKILENSESDWVTLNQDLDLMKLYVKIESMRMNEEIGLSIQIERNIDPENALVPSLFIQPFIENSIKHGISETDIPGKIQIQINQESEERIACVIEDNGAGLKHKTQSFNDKKSLGSYIGQKRLEYLNQLTKNKAKFEMSELESGVQVIVSLPLKTKFE